MPSIEESTVPEEEVTAAPATKATIGIIYPPPEVRNIVDKTASFVARNGPEFESRIRQNELNNPKFNFLNSTDPYHNYYKHKVKEFVEGRAQEPSSAPKSGLGFLQQKPISEQIKINIEALVPKEPPPEFEFIADPPSISAFDLDVVKLTAQFVARNGRQFLTNLMNREQRNYQFDFLRPQHSLFNYFTKLVEQYTKILIPPKDLLSKLKKEAEIPKTIFEQAKYRVEWAKHQERERKREEEEKEKERVAYAQIDWHDFVVVETVDYQPNETGNLPPPTTPDEVGARLIAQERYEQTPADDAVSEGDQREEDDLEDELEEDEIPESHRAPPHAPPPSHGADTRVQDMEEGSDTESEGEDFERRPTPPPREESRKAGEAPPPPPPMPPRDGMQPPPLPPNPDQVVIRKNYDPKAARMQDQGPSPDQFLISPITGERIPADKFQEHMRIGLLDPKWIEQRDRTIQERREQEEVYAPGSSIGSSLKQLAERRTDIFGSGAEETQIGKKIGEEEKKEKSKVIWDGHTASMEKVAQKARENISIEDQIAVIHKVKGLLPDEEKEKIGPAMPKGGPASIPIPPPSQQKNLPSALPPGPRPPLPPTTSAPSSIPAPRPPAPMRPPMAPMPPRPPMVGGIMGVSVQPVPPGVVMMAPPPNQPPLGPGQVMGVRPPMPPMVGPPMPRPPFIPGPPMMPPMGQPPMGQPPMRPPMQQPPPPQPADNDDEPPSKKAKTEDQLMPENEFLAKNQSPVTFRVQMPNMTDKSEWKLTGQSFSVTLPLTDAVSVIKAKIFDEAGMPAGKQKLQLEGMFMKDSNSLAFYNFTPSSVVQLQLKERGGRKK